MSYWTVDQFWNAWLHPLKKQKWVFLDEIRLRSPSLFPDEINTKTSPEDEQLVPAVAQARNRFQSARADQLTNPFIQSQFPATDFGGFSKPPALEFEPEFPSSQGTYAFLFFSLKSKSIFQRL